MQNITQIQIKIKERKIKAISEMRSAGFTYQDIADQFGISKQRVYQIYNCNRNKEDVKKVATKIMNKYKLNA